MNKRRRNKLDLYIDRLEKLGIDHFTKKEEVWSFIIMGILHLVLFAILFFVIPLKAISIPLISIIFVMSIVFFWLDYKDDYGDLEDEKFMIICSLLLIPIALITYFTMLKVLPYRGKDQNLIRRRKLKMLIRKAKINKLKFWK